MDVSSSSTNVISTDIPTAVPQGASAPGGLILSDYGQAPRTTHSDLWTVAKGSRLQSASSESEADWNAQNPTVIGLFSMLIGSDELEEIQAFIRRLRERGNAVLGAKPPINYESILE